MLADFQAIDFKTPFNLISFLLGAESQIDAYLAKVNRLNTDDNVWLEHRIPVDVLELTRSNLQELLSARLQASGPLPLKQIFPGIPLDVLDRELAALAVEGDRHFQTAEQAHRDGDLAAMERNYRITFADFNSRHYYEAGIRLAEHLLSGGRLDEARKVTAALVRNHPAFPQAYRLAARAGILAGRPGEARQALVEGLIYNPGDAGLRETLRETGELKYCCRPSCNC